MRLFQDTRTLFSFPHTLVLRQGEVILGMALGWASGDRREKGLCTAWKLFPFALPRFFLFVPKIFSSGLPPSSYYLSNIAIFPPHQGKGLGRMLLQAVESKALEAGDSCVILDVEKDREKTLSFYLRNGYGRAGTFLSFVRMQKGLLQEQAFRP
ncbi:MAG: GNAT family N-acetyltransferase [Candidatus Caldatribacterium sp.]|nr:GNAT family N-acetyltransferase [Candidatus Caldatribacterium sp.]